MGRAAVVGFAALGLCAAGPPTDPDWPCNQRLVPTLTASSLWGGIPAAGDWRADSRVAAVVAAASPRSVSAEAAATQLDQFAAAVPTADRPAVLAQVFTGLVEETNVQRSEIIGRLHSIAQRQRSLTDITSHVTAELRALPPDAPAAQREEVVSRRGLLIRQYQEIERTIRYACEAPVQMEAKLGVLAQALQRKVGD